MLYLVKSQEWYKVGYAKNVAKRFKDYNTHNPSYVVLGVKKGTLEDEADYHNRWLSYPRKLEWFQLPNEIVEELKTEFVPYQEKSRKNPNLWTTEEKQYTLWCRKSKMRKDGTSPVEVAFYENGKRVVKSLGFNWNPKTFAKDKKKEPLKTKLEQEIKKHFKDENNV